MTIKRAGLFSIHKLLLSGFAALAFVLQPFSGILIQTAAALVPPAGANTVCAVGCTTTTVQAGLDLGGTVFVHNGTYTEQLTFTHDDTTLIGESQLGVILKPLSNSYGQGLTSQLKTNITVKNLSIQTNAASGGYALKAYGGYNLTLQDLSISGNGTTFFRHFTLLTLLLAILAKTDSHSPANILPLIRIPATYT